MGTHGYVVFKYKGIYYIYYNHWDSYCDNLGRIVIDEIDKMISDDSIDFYKNKLLRIPFNDDNSDGCTCFHSIKSSIINYKNSVYYTSEDEPTNEYVYIIDFDEEEFIITKYGDRYIFDLFDIPDNWIDIVEENEHYEYEKKDKKVKNKINNKIKELEKEIETLKELIKDII